MFAIKDSVLHVFITDHCVHQKVDSVTKKNSSMNVFNFFWYFKKNLITKLNLI